MNLFRKSLTIIVVIFGNLITTHSQTMTLDSFLTIAKNEGYYKLKHGYQPEYLYYFNREAAIDLSCIQIDQAIKNLLGKYDNVPYNALNLCERIDRSEKLGDAILNFYNQKMRYLKLDSDPDFSIFTSGRLSFKDLMCSLLKQKPISLKDTLMRDIIFVKNNLIKINPINNSFFEDVWDFISNGFSSHTNYKNGQIVIFIIGQALIELGEEKFVKSIFDECNTKSNYYLKYYVIDCPDRNQYNQSVYERTIHLSDKYNSITEIMNSDLDTFKEMFVNDDDDLTVSDLKLICGNEALFWCQPKCNVKDFHWSGGYNVELVKVVYINENTVKVYFLTSYVI